MASRSIPSVIASANSAAAIAADAWSEQVLSWLHACC